MRTAWLVVASFLVCVPAAEAQELRGFLTLDGHPGYLTNVYLEPSFATWDPSRRSAFGTGGVSGILEWSGERMSFRTNAGARALELFGAADSAETWWSAFLAGAFQWRVGERLGVGLEGSYAESERPDRRRTLWGRAAFRWDASPRVRLSVGPALARIRLSDLGGSDPGPSDGLGPPGLPIPGGSSGESAFAADAVMLTAGLEAWPGGRWQMGVESFLVRTGADDLGLDYVGGGGLVRLTRWSPAGGSISLGLGGEGFGYRAALDEAKAAGEIPEDDMIWRGELDARWPVGGRVDLVTRVATLHRAGSGEGSGLDFYGSVGVRLTLGGTLFSAHRPIELWTREAGGMRIRIPYEGTGRLYLVGDFNAWTDPGEPLRRVGSATHSVMMRLEPGVYRYRIRVVEGESERWLELPQGAVMEEDGFGGRNGVLVVGAGSWEKRR